METVPFIICAVIGCFFVLVRRSLAVQKVKVKSLATIDGFNAAVKYEGVFGGYGLALDPNTNRFAIAGFGIDPYVFDFSQLVAVDVERDGATVTTTKGSNGLAGAAIGVALLGPAGVLLGSGTRSRGISRPTVTKLALKRYVNDLVHPCFEVVFYQNGRGGGANSGLVSNAATRMDEWYGRFRTILAMQASVRDHDKVADTASGVGPTISDAINQDRR